MDGARLINGYPDQHDKDDHLYPGDVRRIREDIYTLRREVRNLFWLVVVMVLWLTAVSLGNDLVDAARDAREYDGRPLYISTDVIAEEHRAEAVVAMRTAVAHMTRTVALASVMPQRITETLYRVDLDRLEWGQMPAIMSEAYPYGVTSPPVIRADWLLVLLDQSDVDAYHRLLFGRKLSTLGDFFSELGVQRGSPEALGWIEDASQVALTGTRLIQTRPSNRRLECFSTYDSRRLNLQTDPLENLGEQFNWDASEHIALVTKTYEGLVGHLQVYALTNGAGEIQAEAPADIVTDYVGSRASRGPIIRNPISCMVCHEKGLNRLGTSAVGSYLDTGAELIVPPEKLANVDRLYLSDLNRLVDRHNVDFEDMMKALTGVEAAEAVSAVRSTLARYDASVSLSAAARELRVSEDSLRGILGATTTSARLAMLSAKPVPRAAFEDLYLGLFDALNRNPSSHIDRDAVR